MARFVQPIPSPGKIKDPELRRILEAIIANMNAWAGKSRTASGEADDERRLIDLEEMVESRIGVKSLRGRLVRRADHVPGKGNLR